MPRSRPSARVDFKSTRTATCTMGPDCMSYGDESEASNLGLSKGEVAAAGSILGNILGHL